MMKGKRTLSLAMSLIALCGALSACSEDYTYPDSKWTEGQIVTVAGHQYTFDDIYKAFERRIPPSLITALPSLS